MENNSQYLHPQYETMSREEISRLQAERLQATVRHCMNVPFYQKKFAELGITPDDIKTADDVRKLPFTTKQDLRDTFATPTPSDWQQCHSAIVCASTPPAAPPATPPSSSTPSATLTSGPTR